MSRTEDIREGYEVYDASGSRIGRVRRWAGAVLDLGDRRIPASAISRVEGSRVYLADVAAASASDRLEDRDELRVPVVEERLDVEKRAGQLGEVRLHREVVEEQVAVPVELRREIIYVEQRAVESRPARPGELEGAFQETTIRVPVRGEEAVVSKEAVVTGEVVVDKEQTVERQEIRDIVRRVEVEVDEDYQRARGGLQEHFAGRQGTTAGRTFEDAEEHYRYGWQVSSDERYAGRTFEDVEPELRRAYRSAGYSDDEWEQLREAVREGWNQARR